MPKLETELIDIFLACCNKKLDKINIKWKEKKTLCIVVCSKGYPDIFEKKVEIKNLDKLEISENDFIFHAGTIEKDDKVLAVGGRVLNFVSISDNFELAKKNILENIKKLNWSGGFFRKDIGYKVIKK